MENKIQYPKVGGAKIVQTTFSEIRNRKPSEELIRIINKNNEIIDKEDLTETENRDRAARSPEAGV